MKALPEAEETFGYITKENRQNLGLPKEHYIDAVVIAGEGKVVDLVGNRVLYKRCIAKGDYQCRKGIRSEKKLIMGKIEGFRKFDKVMYKGKEYFIKGLRTRGVVPLMRLSGKPVVGLQDVKLSKMKRLTSRKSWLISYDNN